jgi:hypothetical protein
MMTTPRILILAAAAAVLSAQTLAPAHASTFTYDLTLNSFGDSGTGSLTLNGPVASGTFTPGGGGLNSLSIFIDGDTFTLNNAQPGTSASFQNGILTSLFYSGHVGNEALTLAFAFGFGGYSFNGPDEFSLGTFSASATPLPPTWTMMLIGLAGVGFMLYRRKGRDSFTGVAPA